MRNKWIHLVCVSALSGLLPTDLTRAAEPNLVGWWPFDETSGTVAQDISGQGSDGVLHNGPQWTEGVTGGALRFDGVNDYVELPIGSIITGARNVTASIWVNFDRESTGAWQRIFDFGKDTNTYFFLSPRTADNGPLRCAISTTGAAGESLVSAAAALPGGWQHVVVMINGDTKVMTVYLNGTQVAGGPTRLIPSDLGATTRNWLGCSQYPGDAFYRGLLDDLRLYDRVLTPTEIEEIYETTVPVDDWIASDPDKAMARASERLRQLARLRTDAAMTEEQVDATSRNLLIVARAKRAKGAPSAEVLTDLRALAERFPNSRYATDALCTIVALDTAEGLEYATGFLERLGDAKALISLYVRLICSSGSRLDYASAEKYVGSFVRRYAASEDIADAVAQLMSSLDRNPGRERLYELLERTAFQDPNSAFCCAIFKQRVAALSHDADTATLVEMAESVRQGYPGTRLGACAAAVLADIQYEGGHYVKALEAFTPGLFAGTRTESAIITDVDNAISLYRAHTGRAQGVDVARLHRSLADYCQQSNLYRIAVHCCQEAAKARELPLDAFINGTGAEVKYCNTGPDKEIWFWRGLLAEDDGDSMAAYVMYEHFLRADTGSALAARALYGTSRIQMMLGWYADAKASITKAKSIVPCPPVIQVEQELEERNGSGEVSLN